MNYQRDFYGNWSYHCPTALRFKSFKSKGGYEARVCVFEPGSADLAVRASLQAIAEVVNDFEQ
ncbi:MAG: hypothetical protein QGI31_04260 [Dehalococcoidia bacterium]|nr:hypothetical protein [Dehalococcoidia bacterium]